MYYDKIKHEIKKNSTLLRRSRIMKDKLIENQYYPPLGLILDNIEYSKIKLEFLIKLKKVEIKRLHSIKLEERKNHWRKA